MLDKETKEGKWKIGDEMGVSKKALASDRGRKREGGVHGRFSFTLFGPMCSFACTYLTSLRLKR